MKLRCHICQSILGEQTPEGLLVRKENHQDLLIEGVIRIWCEKNHENIVGMSGESMKQKPEEGGCV